MLDRNEIQKVCDEYHGPQYYDWFRDFVRRMYYELSNPGLNLRLRKIYFTRAEAEAALVKEEETL